MKGWAEGRGEWEGAKAELGYLQAMQAAPAAVSAGYDHPLPLRRQRKGLWCCFLHSRSHRRNLHVPYVPYVHSSAPKPWRE
jgi:hypothetical protein